MKVESESEVAQSCPTPIVNFKKEPFGFSVYMIMLSANTGYILELDYFV